MSEDVSGCSLLSISKKIKFVFLVLWHEVATWCTWRGTS
jgi:hypothetical protein